MEPVKVVLRYSDGRVLKGSIQDFFPNKDRSHLFRADKPSGEAIELLMKELKVIFVGRDFIGKPLYQQDLQFPPL